MSRLAVYAAKRIALIPLMLLLIATLSFVLLRLLPGDPAVLVVGEFAGPEELAKVHAALHLDDPLWQQYVTYLWDTLRGDLGTSYLTGIPVLEDVLRRLPNSLFIIIPSLLVAVLLGTLVGTAGGYLRRKFSGRFFSAGISALQGVPPFLVGIVLIYLFVFTLRIFPTPTGMLYASTTPPPERSGIMLVDAVLAGQWNVLGAMAAHAILPVISTALFLASYFAKTVRTGVTDALAGNQIEFARGCGLPEHRVIRYALLTSRTSVLTYAAILFGVMLSATAVIEIVFSWPGIGAWALDGVLKGDLPVIQGFIVVTGGLVILAYVVLDILVAALDPRIR
ncbi:ABC transporter permease [Amycolatopsis jejuensis]|uniref:ABC transporter permease n=1 Tax=Amycolatopsis jejuensis TaxID=330084 RepID=UPI000527AE9E|nr:ABC transporter permease [Amycolatopsis jejuensis]